MLGQGSYAEVYLVRHLKSESYFALKRMKKKTYNGLIKFVITEKEV
jgi:serine/threonine protein kinase